MPEITMVLDDLNGALLVEDNYDLNYEARQHLTVVHGAQQDLACARPLAVLPPPVALDEAPISAVKVRIAGFYHNSLTEGPGRRSSVLFQFCPLKCAGCYVPQLHSRHGGALVSAAALADLLLDANYERDGVTILGGEPFAQVDGLLELVRELRSKGCRHIVCYSGYTLEALRERAARAAAINQILNEIDILIDGAFVQSLASGAGAWTGSANQRVIDVRATAKAGKTILYQTFDRFEQQQSGE